jgi:hypothetical protein
VKPTSQAQCILVIIGATPEGKKEPANHHGRGAGVPDSPAEALAYLRATAPQGWRESDHQSR